MRRDRATARRNRAETRFAWLLLLPAAVCVFGVIAYPLLKTLQISLFSVNSVVDPAPEFVGFGNYLTALATGPFWESIGRTVYFTVVSLAIELLLGFGLALLLNAPLRYRWLFRTCMVIPWALPTIVNAAIWKGIYNAQYGALNAVVTQLGLVEEYQTWLGDPWLAMNLVIVADAWKTTPLVAFFLLAGLSSIPAESLEAAKVDGASWWQTLTQITLPLLVPSISIVVVLRTVEAFKVFDIIYAMTRGGPANGTSVISYYTYTTAFSDQQYGMGSALSLLIVAAILALCAVYLRLMRKSETSLL